jgi:hypothetical protein
MYSTFNVGVECEDTQVKGNLEKKQRRHPASAGLFTIDTRNIVRIDT